MPTLLARHTELAYTDEGAGPPVILVHGSASTRGQWRAAVLDLSPRFRVLAPDLHGYGATPLPPALESLTFDDEVELVDALVDLVGEDVHLVGHSYGGALCLRAASLRPERVASLVLIEPTAFHLLHLLGEHAAWREIESVAARHIALAGAGDLAACADHFLGYWIGLDAWRAMPAGPARADHADDAEDRAGVADGVRGDRSLRRASRRRASRRSSFAGPRRRSPRARSSSCCATSSRTPRSSRSRAPATCRR